MRVWVALSCVAMLAVTGCSHRRSQAASPGGSPAGQAAGTAAGNKPIVTLDTTLQGRIVKLQNTGRFVVVSFPVGHLPAAGMYLNVYRSGLKVGEVVVTGFQRDDRVIADISSGEAAEGDVVRDH